MHVVPEETAIPAGATVESNTPVTQLCVCFCTHPTSVQKRLKCVEALFIFAEEENSREGRMIYCGEKRDTDQEDVKGWGWKRREKESWVNRRRLCVTLRGRICAQDLEQPSAE